MSAKTIGCGIGAVCLIAAGLALLVFMLSPQETDRDSPESAFREAEATPSPESVIATDFDSMPPLSPGEMTESEILETPADTEVEAVNGLGSLDELLLFFPQKHPSGDWQPADLEFEDVWFASADGTQLHAWYCPANDPQAFVLYSHGNGGHLADRTPLLRRLQQELQLSVLIYDYRGYGRSDGKATVRGILEDARAARMALTAKAGIGEHQLVLMGRSLGGAVAVQLARETPPRGLILESTFSSLRTVAAHHYPKLAWLVKREKLDSLSLIREIDAPLLISHGDRDRTIPFSHGEALYEAARGPKSFVPILGGDHNDVPADEYYVALREFIASLDEE